MDCFIIIFFYIHRHELLEGEENIYRGVFFILLTFIYQQRYIKNNYEWQSNICQYPLGQQSGNDFFPLL